MLGILTSVVAIGVKKFSIKVSGVGVRRVSS